MESMRWFERKFGNAIELEAFPSVVERLRGAPVRVEEKVRDLPNDELTTHIGETWSIQENVGHLLDLEELWLGRVEDFLNGKEELRHADLTNRKTHEANHHASGIDVLVSEFREQRLHLIARLEELEESDVARTALHPRLKTAMRLIDLCHFVAEHDDHHLARMEFVSKLLR